MTINAIFVSIDRNINAIFAETISKSNSYIFNDLRLRLIKAEQKGLSLRSKYRKHKHSLTL